MDEAELTVGMLSHLSDLGWSIVCFDFPQSGTGYVLHSNKKSKDSKNEKSVIPDIISFKNGVVLYFENKDKFTKSDFDKIKRIKNSDEYIESLRYLLRKFDWVSIYYGIGLPKSDSNLSRSLNELQSVDFVALYDGVKIECFYNDNMTECFDGFK
ncbi:hypothetical protein FUA23_17435 [Neolewinella aurantiaca]|uniref:Uncharacterized protein n=1 Tax=Neolewinella aurantiaca TaxID=2602767 RepID=A0A5C7FE09_9BACT|nr:hypothetical protein [Neolewinella aurantiaca]TXF87716.1 hypothetical protein FUA23_17435 [Neolewinella aurantiaca]